MPAVEPGETREHYMGRCVPFVMKEEGLDNSAAVGKCEGMFDQHTKKSASDMDCVHKAYGLADGELTVEGGDVVAVVSADNVDDEGEVVIPKNLNFDRYRKDRHVFFDHDQERHPIGSAKWIKAISDGNSSKALSKYFFHDKTELARAVGDLVKAGVYRCHSIGCLKSTRKLGDPSESELKARPDWKGAKIWRGTPVMMEFSVTPYAANPECVALAVSKSWSKATVDLLTGVTANTEQAAAAITADVRAVERTSKRILTDGDYKGLIAASLERVTKSINPDDVIGKVLKNLSQ